MGAHFLIFFYIFVQLFNIFHFFLLSAEQEQQDFITCGDCQHEFKLCDIVKFIQHKVNGCNKENVDPFENNDPGSDDSPPEGSEPVSLIGNRRTSISAPIANRGTPELRDKSSPRPSREQLPSTAASSALEGAKSANNSNHNNDDDDEEDSNEDDVDDVETSSRRKKKCVANSESNGPNQGQFISLHYNVSGHTKKWILNFFQ